MQTIPKSNPIRTVFKRGNMPGLTFALAAAVVLAAGCQAPRQKYTDLPSFHGSKPSESLTRVNMTNQLNPDWLQPPQNLFTLGPGDKVELEIIGEITSKTITMVAPDGKIYFNLLPGVDVWGLTLAQAKARLEDELSKFVRERPQVSLVLRAIESKRIWILGRVQAPGVYAMTMPTTVLEAISMAGGTAVRTVHRRKPKVS